MPFLKYFMAFGFIGGFKIFNENKSSEKNILVVYFKGKAIHMQQIKKK